MNCGLEAELVSYNGSLDIAVKFKDGSVKQSRMVSFSGVI